MVLDNLVMAEDGHSVSIREEVMHEAFAHDVPLAAFDAVRHLIVPQPTAPLAVPLSITEERWGSIPRYYIECTADPRDSTRDPAGHVHRDSRPAGVQPGHEPRADLRGPGRAGGISDGVGRTLRRLASRHRRRCRLIQECVLR